MAKYNFENLANDYMTPKELYQDILYREDLKEFDLDVCCTIKNIPAKNYYINGVHNGLVEPWAKNNWMNPPFDECDKWVKKAYREQILGNTTFSIIPARTETGYWHDYILNDSSTGFKENVECILLRKGLCFIDPQTLKPVQQKIIVKDTKTKKAKVDPITGENVYKMVDGVFKNALALVTFRGMR